MKKPDYVMKLIELWMMLNDLEGANTNGDWKENGVCKSESFVYKKLSGMHFR